MKIVVMSMALLAQSASAEFKFFDRTKSDICDRIAAEHSSLSLSKKTCKEGTFTSLKEMSDTLNGQSRITRVNAKVQFEDKEFEFSMARSVGITKSGRISLSGDFPLITLLNGNLGVADVLMSAAFKSKNVKRTRTSQGLPDAVSEWYNYGELPDWDIVSIRYFKITHPEKRRIIGYFVEEDACSWESDQCARSLAKFDLKGNIIGEIVEEYRDFDE